MHEHCEPGSAHCADLHEHSDGQVTRRNMLLAGAGLTVGAALPLGAALPANAALPMGTAPLGTALPAAPAFAGVRRWRPDAHSPRFTLVVMPDTQYLFDEDRGDARPLDASLRWILDHAEDENIVFLSHLGDLTQNGLASEFDGIGRSFRVLDRAGAPYSVLAGNHDIRSSTDDQRGESAYLTAFGPSRCKSSATYGGSSPDGYNSFHVFRAGGRQWLVLALDWRPSARGIVWAQSVIDRHPSLPVILTTHEIAFADDAGEAHLSDFGRQLWDRLIARNDQIFLTLNGHFWPPGRTVLRNDAGHDVHVHITNYQDRYYGGGAMIRLYRFDLARARVDVSTVSPYFLGMPAAGRNELARLEVERTGPADRFSLDIDFPARFAGFAPVAPRPSRPAAAVVVPGTLAYWRFDGAGQSGAGAAGQPGLSGAGVGQANRFGVGGTGQAGLSGAGAGYPDLSGKGNHLTVVGGVPARADDHHADQPAHASLRFAGDGTYLRTADNAPLNTVTLDRGYTVEAFLKLPPDFEDGHGWCGLFTRMGTGHDVGKTGDDPSEPAATLNISSAAEVQWAVWPQNQNRISTNWSHLLPLDRWWHVAIVNDGKHTVMYVDGCPVARNPSTPAVGISSAGRFWMLGAYHYADAVQSPTFYGLLGDVRIVGRPLTPAQFLIA